MAPSGGVASGTLTRFRGYPIAEFPALLVGVTYLPIPIGGAITLLFVAERLLIGRPQRAEAHGGIVTPD